MPRTKLGEKFSKRPPRIDWLWAAILERKMAYKCDLKTLSSDIGVSYNTMRKVITKPTREWPPAILESVCKKFDIQLIPSVGGETPDWRGQ